MVNIDGTLREITDDIRSAKEARIIANAVDEAESIVMYSDLEGNLTDINQSGLCLFDKEKNALLGKPIRSLLPQADRELFMIFYVDLLQTGFNEAVFPVMRGNGERRYFEWRAIVVKVDRRSQHIKWLARDVTAAFERHRRRRNDEKLQGVLEMAGGVAHALNQPLTIVNNLLTDVSADLEIDTEIDRKIKRIRHQIRKMNDIAKKIGSIRQYVAMDYVAGIKIVDIEKAAWEHSRRERP
jgi:signal transduction histidine kinase